MPNEMPSPAVPQGTTEVNILTSVDPLPQEAAAYEYWRLGLTWRSTIDITAESQPHGCTDVMWSDRNDELAIPAVKPFTIGTVHGCEGVLQASERQYETEAEQALINKQAWLVAHEVWTGEQGGLSLQSTATTLSGSGSVREVIAYAIYNHQEATKGGRSVVHIPYVALDEIADVVTRVGNRLQLVDGTVIIPGPGYPGGAGDWGPLSDAEDPESGATAGGGEVWVYVTGPMELALSATRVTPTHWHTGNLFQVHAQREVIARWDPTYVYAGLATL